MPHLALEGVAQRPWRCAEPPVRFPETPHEAHGLEEKEGAQQGVEQHQTAKAPGEPTSSHK